jgi:16S rRNA (adenine1518-N6/adenine1519-N6)-dimethyltransferase
MMLPSSPATGPTLADLPPLREVIAAYDLGAKKSFGQHFLLDLNVTRRIVREGGDFSSVHVLEVGPGPGGLTRALLESPAASVTAIERDPRFITALQDVVRASCGRLQLIEADALALDHLSLIPSPRAVVANLPYNVGTPLLFAWLRDIRSYCSLTLMFQKEVADRIVARPGEDAYGRLSVMAQWRAECRWLFDLPPRAFTPPPKVASAIVSLIPRPRPQTPEPDFVVMEKLVAAAFGQRRKMLRASLRSLMPNPEPLLRACDIDPTARAETLNVADFVRLSLKWQADRSVNDTPDRL